MLKTIYYIYLYYCRHYKLVHFINAYIYPLFPLTPNINLCVLCMPDFQTKVWPFDLDFRDQACVKWMINLIVRTCITSAKVTAWLNAVLQNHCLKRCYLNDKYLEVSTYRYKVRLGHIVFVKGMKTLVKWGADKQDLVSSEYRWIRRCLIFNNRITNKKKAETCGVGDWLTLVISLILGMEDDSPAVQTNLLSIDDVTQEVKGILSSCVAWAPAQHTSQVIS